MDRTTKILLAAIALGLFANATTTVVTPAMAQYYRELSSIGTTLLGIETHLQQIATSLKSIESCVNKKRCF